MLKMEEARARRWEVWRERRQHILLEMQAQELGRRVMFEAKEVHHRHTDIESDGKRDTE